MYHCDTHTCCYEEKSGTVRFSPGGNIHDLVYRSEICSIRGSKAPSLAVVLCNSDGFDYKVSEASHLPSVEKRSIYAYLTKWFIVVY